MPLAHGMHRILNCTAYIYYLEQKAAYLAEKISHSLNGNAQTEFYNTMPSQLEDALVPNLRMEISN